MLYIQYAFFSTSCSIKLDCTVLHLCHHPPHPHLTNYSVHTMSLSLSQSYSVTLPTSICLTHIILIVLLDHPSSCILDFILNIFLIPLDFVVYYTLANIFIFSTSSWLPLPFCFVSYTPLHPAAMCKSYSRKTPHILSSFSKYVCYRKSEQD